MGLFSNIYISGRLPVLLLLLISSISFLRSAEKDTMKASLPEIHVNAEGIITSSALKYSPVSRLTKSDIKESGAVQVSDVLTLSPGIQVKDYGGLGGIKTVSIRGTSAEQALVLIDGMKINSVRNGYSDLSIIPVSLINNVEVIRGGASAIFGGNAIGGVINLRTDITGGKPQTGVMIGYGSFNEQRAVLQTSYPLKKFGLEIDLDYLSSDGNYPFTANQFGVETQLYRQNADFKNISLAAAAGVNLSGWKINSRALIRQTSRGTPGPVLQNNIGSSESRLRENESIFILSSLKEFKSSSLYLGLLGKISKMDYTDPSLPENVQKSKFDENEARLLLKYSKDMDILNLWLSLETGSDVLEGTMLQPEVGNKVSRQAAAASLLFDSYEVDIDSGIGLQFTGGARIDIISDAGNAVSPLAGFIIDPKNLPVKFRGQYSYNFRPPGFNEMYYYNYGTDDLKPERSHSFNLGCNWSPFGFIALEPELFLIATRDQIISVPKSPVSWSAENMGRVLTRGFELNIISAFAEDMIKVRFSYTRQLATDESPQSLTKGKEIVYVPRELIGGDAIFKPGKSYKAGLVYNYSSYRYASQDNSPESAIPSYFILNCFLSWKIKTPPFEMETRFDCINLFDVNYQVIKNYPMPGRSFRGSISFNF